GLLHRWSLVRARLLAAGSLLVAAMFTAGGVIGAGGAQATVIDVGSGAATTQRALPDILGCTNAPTPEVPGRGVVGFFESAPKSPPPAADPFVAHSTTSIYEQYGYAGLRRSEDRRVG